MTRHSETGTPTWVAAGRFGGTIMAIEWQLRPLPVALPQCLLFRLVDKHHDAKGEIWNHNVWQLFLSVRYIGSIAKWLITHGSESASRPSRPFSCWPEQRSSPFHP
jgi:hypothetical protein